MDLTKNIFKQSDIPFSIDKGIICLNFEHTNFVYNFPTLFIENRKIENKNEAVGVWKIKQLKN